MGDHDTSSLPPVPDVQLTEPQLTVPGYQPPSLGMVPPLSLGGGGAGTPGWGATGGGSPAAMNDVFGHLTDPPLAPVAQPGAPNIFAPIPAAPQNPLQLNGLGPISNAVNPWLADPMGVAGDQQRRIDMLPPTDPGLAKQQTIFHAPTLSF
jgi:hypothetical protein